VRFVDDEQRLTAILVVRLSLAAARSRREQPASERAVPGRRRLGRRAGSARRRAGAASLAAGQVEVETGRVGVGGGSMSLVVGLQVVGAEATTNETHSGREVLPPAGQRHLAPQSATIARCPTTHSERHEIVLMRYVDNRGRHAKCFCVDQSDQGRN